MKKFKNLSFAIYVVAVVLVVVGAVIFTSINNKSNNDNNSNNVSNSNTTVNTTTNNINFSINCSDSYIIYVDSVLIFENNFYSCNKAVDIKINSEGDSSFARFVNNKFSATKKGIYSLAFYVDDKLQHSIFISVIESKLNTIFSLGEELDLTKFKENENSICNIEGSNFIEKDGKVIATTAGFTNLEISTKIDEFVTKIDKFMLKVTPIVKIFNSYYEEMIDNAITVFTNDNVGIFIIEVTTDLINPIECSVDVNSSNSNIIIINQDPIFMVSGENNATTGEISLTVEANNLVTTITFTINLVEEGN